MTMTIGELVGYIDLKDKGFGKGVDQAGRGLDRLESATSSSMSSIEGTVSRALSQIETDIASGLDPASAIADLDRLERALDDGLKSMLDEADQFASELDKAIDEAYDGLDDKARKGGEDASRGFTDGVGDGGQSRLSGIGDKLIGGLKGLGWAAAGAAIGELISQGIGAALDLDAARAKLQAQVGDPALVAEIGKAAGAVYGRGFTETLGEATEAARAVLSTGLVPKGDAAALEDLTVKAQAYATAWDTDVADAVQYASTLVGSGLAKNATNAFDLITEASRRVPTALREDVLEAGDEYSQFFRALGFSGEQAFGLLAKAAEKGQYGIDKTGDALKEFTLRATTMDSATKGAYQAIGLNAEKMSNALLAGGDKAQDAFHKIVSGLLSIKDPTERANTAIALFGTPLEDMNKADIPAFLKNLRDVGSGLGDVSGKAKGTGDAFESSASQKLQAFKNSLQENVVNFLGGTVVPALEGLGNKFDLSGIGEKIGPVIEKVKGFFSGLFGDIQAWVSEHQGDIQGWVDKIQSAFESMSGVVSGVIDIVKGLWSTFGDDILNILGTVIDTLLGVWNGFWTTFQGVIDVFAGIIQGDWSRVWEGVKGIFSGVLEAIKSLVTGALGLISTNISATWDAVKSATGSAWEGLKNAVSTAISNVVDFVKKLPDRILDAVGDLGKLLVKSGKDMITGLWSGIQSMAGWIKEKVTGFFGGLVPDWVKQAIDAHSPSRVFATIGGYVGQGFVQGILQEQPRAQMTARQFAKLVKDAMSVDLKGAPDPFVEWVKHNNDQLKDLADKRAEIIKTIADAKKYADQIASQMQDFASVANLGLGEGDGAGDIVSGLQTKLDQIKTFANDIKKLASSGLNKTTLAQIINAGPEKGLSLAEILVGADGAEIKAINKAQGQIDKVSKQMGKNSADALYDVGKQAGQGFLKGLQGQLKETESMMAKIAKAVIAAAKKELGVKSPSRVFMGIGDNTMVGYIRGVLGQQSATVSAVAGVVGKAATTASRVPGLVPGAMAGPTAAPAYGGEYGQGHGQAFGAGPGGVVVNMPGAVVREQADINRLGAEFAFKYRARG